MENNPRIAHEVNERILNRMARLQENLLIVSTMTSVEKVRASRPHLGKAHWHGFDLLSSAVPAERA